MANIQGRNMQLYVLICVIIYSYVPTIYLIYFSDLKQEVCVDCIKNKYRIQFNKAHWEAATEKFKIMFHYVTPPPGVSLRGHDQRFTRPWRLSDFMRVGWSEDRVPVEERFSARVHTVPEAHPASCSIGTGSLSRGKVVMA
jgi:hypothetical protein